MSPHEETADGSACSASQAPNPAENTNANVAARLSTVANLMPGAIAIAQLTKDWLGRQGYGVTTFKNLDQRSDAIARGLLHWGVRPGMRMAMLVPFSSEFIELTFALLKAGVVPVLVDPGMGRQHLVQCLSESAPDGFLGIPKAQAIRTVLRSKFPAAKWNVTVGRRLFWGGKTLAAIEASGRQHAEIAFPTVKISDGAAVIFTTGSTGPPKGVLYTHGTFHAQIKRIQQRYGIHRGSRDLACFPLFGLFDAVMGVTTVIPDMDPTRPADVDPAKLIAAADHWEIDQAFGSPALWNTVVRWCDANGRAKPFPTLKRVLSAGAPVPAATLQRLRGLVHEDADIVTPYGATEALPIASIESREVIAQTGPAAAKGKGVCVGTRFDDVQWRIIKIDDGPIPEVGDTVEVPRGKIGELMVTGPMVTTQYVVRSDQNALHKVADRDRVWHRMGDVGYLDEADRFWFCGRKAHRVTAEEQDFFTVPCEAIFNAHPSVYRSALVGRGPRGSQTPTIIIEPQPDKRPKTESQKQALIDELKSLAARNPLTGAIMEIVIRDQPLPVDIRHNSKIFREQLAAEINVS